MTVGNRLKKIRELRKVKQKELGVKIGYPELRSEVRISQYENDNRTPKSDVVEKMAYYLDVNPIAISGATVDNELGAMHLLFMMEELYDLHPETVDGRTVLCLEAFSGLFDRFEDWSTFYNQYKNGEITEEEYLHFKYSYPLEVSTKRTLKK